MSTWVWTGGTELKARRESSGTVDRNASSTSSTGGRSMEQSRELSRKRLSIERNTGSISITVFIVDSLMPASDDAKALLAELSRFIVGITNVPLSTVRVHLRTMQLIMYGDKEETPHYKVRIYPQLRAVA
jgi:hypothetical protein